MRQFPAFYNMQDAHVVVFGDGEAAQRKVRLLAKTPARIYLVSDTRAADLVDVFSQQVEQVSWDHAADILPGARFAIIACETETDSDKAIRLARQSHLPINVVDQPELCDFTVPSILDRGEIVAAVGSGGAAPVLAKKVRTQLEALLPQSLGPLSRLAREFRPAVKAALVGAQARRQFWESALNGKPAKLALAGEFEAARMALETLLKTYQAPAPQHGTVHIVGAGPGDPELLTLKAFRLIQDADIVFHDRLVSDEIMDLVRRDATRVSVGKAKANHTVPQADIHALMIAAAQQGQRVVRLKGGDPFVFGRGGEEVEALRAAGIEATVVPGISSAMGCAASAGVPLTHRDHAQALTFVTGHAKEGGVPDLDWGALARSNQTVVVFMGVGTSAAISAELIAAGRAPSTPIAIIENGTKPNEIKVFGTLSQLPHLIQRAGIKGPALLVIGEVAAIPARVLKTHDMETAA